MLPRIRAVRVLQYFFLGLALNGPTPMVIKDFLGSVATSVVDFPARSFGHDDVKPFRTFINRTAHVKLPSGTIVALPRCKYEFKRWEKEPLKDSYGNKPNVEVDGKASFAELAILDVLLKAGWDGVWVDTFSHGVFRRSLRPSECDLPQTPAQLYKRISAANARGISGWFDVFAWKGNEYLFVESKYKDAVLENQKQWLEAALNCGLRCHHFSPVSGTSAERSEGLFERRSEGVSLELT